MFIAGVVIIKFSKNRIYENRNLFLLTSGLAFPLLGAYAQKTPKPNIIILCVMIWVMVI